MKLNFINEAQQLWSSVVKNDITDTYELQLQLEIHKKLLSIFQIGSYYYFIFNVVETELDFISEGVKKVLDYDQDEVTANLLLSRIHPDDQSFFLKFEESIIKFYISLPFEKIPFYKIQYDYRIRKKDDTYVRILHQSILIHYDEQKNFYRSLGLHTDISHLKADGNPVFSIIGLEDEPSYINIQTLLFAKNPFQLFTKREKEILKYIVEGKKSEEIAQKLFISLHTVNTHRKKILQKANVKSPIDLVLKSIREAWI